MSEFCAHTLQQEKFPLGLGRVSIAIAETQQKCLSHLSHNSLVIMAELSLRPLHENNHELWSSSECVFLHKSPLTVSFQTVRVPGTPYEAGWSPRDPQLWGACSGFTTLMTDAILCSVTIILCSFHSHSLLIIMIKKHISQVRNTFTAFLSMPWIAHSPDWAYHHSCVQRGTGPTSQPSSLRTHKVTRGWHPRWAVECGFSVWGSITGGECEFTAGDEALCAACRIRCFQPEFIWKSLHDF